MKTKAFFLTILFFTFYSIRSAFAQLPHHEKTLLWEISGNNLEKPSYLFGTIHLLDSVYYFLDNKVVEIFTLSDKIVFEIDMDQPDFQKKSLLAALMKNDSLDNILSDEEYQKVNDFFKTEFQIPLSALKKMNPFYLASMIDGLSMPKNSKGYEQDFLLMAKQQNKEILGISTINSESELLDGISRKDQIKSLMKAMDEYYEGFERKQWVMEAFQEQDIDEIFSIMKGATKEYETIYEAMFPKRHQVWIPNMKELMTLHSCFFAVGVGHLAGEEGILELLKQEGYEVKPIFTK